MISNCDEAVPGRRTGRGTGRGQANFSPLLRFDSQLTLYYIKKAEGIDCGHDDP